MAHDRFDECHSFNVLGFIQLLYDTTCVNSDFWVKPVWGLGCVAMMKKVTSYVSLPTGRAPGNDVRFYSSSKIQTHQMKVMVFVLAK